MFGNMVFFICVFFFLAFFLVVHYVIRAWGVLGCDTLEILKIRDGDKKEGRGRMRQYLKERYYQQQDLLMFKLRRYRDANFEGTNFGIILADINTDFDIRLLDKRRLFINFYFYTLNFALL